MSRACRSLALGAALLLVPAPTIASGISVAVAAEAVQGFEIPAGSLGTVLTAIGAAGHRAIAFPADLTRGRRAGPIRGTMTLHAAIDRALAGTGLVQVGDEGGPVTVRAELAGDRPKVALPTRQADGRPSIVTDLADIDVVANSSVYNDNGFQPGAAGDTFRLAKTPIEHVPLSIGIVTSDVIQSQGTTTVTDALRNVPGVALAPIGYGSTPYSIRGFTTAGIYVDSMYDAGNGYATLPVDDLERVEVLRGPTSILTGVSSDGGLVNVVTRQPTDLPVREVTVRYGSFGYKTLDFDLGGRVPKTEGLTYRLNVSGNIADQSYGGYKRPHETLVAPALKWEDRDTSVTVAGRYYDVSTPIPTLAFVSAGAGLYATPRGLPQGDPNYFYGSRTAAIKADATHDFGQFGGIDVSIGNHAQISTASLGGNYFVWGQDKLGATTYGFDPIAQTAGKQGLTERADITAKYDAGFMRDVVRVGYDFLNYKTDQFVTSYDEVGINPQSGLPLVAQRTYADVLDQIRSKGDNNTSGGYVLDQVDTIDNRLHIFGLVRDDHFYNQAGLTAYVPGEPTFMETATLSQYGLSWVGGGVFDLTRWMSVYGNRSNGFLTQNGLAASATPLGPVRNDLSEVGARYVLFDKLMTVKTSLYELEQTNVGVPNPADPSGLTDILVPGERSRGFEASAAGEVAPGLNVIASAAINHAVYASALDTGIVQAAPRFIGSVWATYTVQRGVAEGFTFGFGAHGNSSSFTRGFTSTFAAATNTIPGYVVEDAMVGYTHDRYSLRFNLNNLSNRYFFYPSFNGETIVVGEGRNALLTGKYDF